MAKSPETESARKLIESLCDLEVPETIRISPDAQQVLYSTQLAMRHKKGKNQVSTLWLAELGKPNSSRQITSGGYKDHAPRWSPDGQSIAFISDRPEVGKKWAIYVWNFRGGVPEGEPHAVTDAENERVISAFEFSPNGKKIAFICADAKTAEEKAREENGEDWKVWGAEWTYDRLKIVDVTTKEVSAALGSSGSKNLSERHAAGFCWSRSGDEIAVVSAATPHIEEPYLSGCDIDILHLAKDTLKNVCHVPNFVFFIIWSSDGSLYFLSGAPIDKSCASTAMYTVSASPGAQYKRSAFGVENDVEQLLDIQGEVVALVQHEMEYRIYMPPDRVIYKKPEQTKAWHAALPTDSDELLLVIAKSDVNRSTEVYSTAASGGSMVRLSNHGALFEGRHWGDCQILSCQSSDKEVTLDSVLFTPPDIFVGEPQPTAVLIHGGPSDRATNAFNSHYFYWTPLLLAQGYSVLLPNYRGSTGKGQSFTEYSSRGVGKYDYEDIVTITNHAVESGFSDANRLIVGGLSQGGFLSYLCSTRNGSMYPWKFQAAIPFNGVSETDTMSMTSDLGATLETELQGGVASWTTSKKDTRARQASAIWEVNDAVKKAKDSGEMVIPPMLILHSEKDERCPVEQAVGFRRALQYHCLPFEFVLYPRQGHIMSEQKFWINATERMLRWVKTYIGPGNKAIE